MKYKVEKRRDNINHRDLYIPQPAAGQPVGIKEICDKINEMCTVTPADVVAVVNALQTVVGNCLAAGNSVRLGDLGNFWIKMNATAAASPDEVTAANINEVGVKFRAAPALKHRINNVRFERQESEKN